MQSTILNECEMSSWNTKLILVTAGIKLQKSQLLVVRSDTPMLKVFIWVMTFNLKGFRTTKHS